MSDNPGFPESLALAEGGHSATPPLPTPDELLGPARLPTPDELLGKPPTGGAVDTSALPLDDADFASAWAPILQDWGHRVAGHVDQTPLGLNADQTKSLRDVGIFPDYQQGHASLVQGFNQMLIGGIAQGLDIGLMRLPELLHGVAVETPGLGPLAAAMEVFPLGHVTGFPAGFATMTRAIDLKIIGKGEAGWKGVEPDIDAAARQAQAPTGAETPTEQLARRGTFLTIDETQPAAPDVHQVARQIAPGTFAQYDPLTAAKEAARQRLDELSQARAASPEAAALQDQMDTIMARVHGREVDLTTAAQRRYNTAYFALHDLLSEDTPEMAGARRDLLAADEKMRDLAPQVSAAYRDAAQRPEIRDQRSSEGIPATAPEIPVEAAGAPEAVPSAETGATPEPAAPAAVAPATLPIPPAGFAEIAGDVRRQLAAAGRPPEEADAAAAVIAAHYEARAARFGGALGTPYELYQAEGAQIRGRAQGGPGGMAAGRSTLRDARTIITLFQKADASTFIHETGHQWLGELLRDAEDPRAQQELRDDAATVRNWLGAAAGEPTRKQHEMFARGIEAYMMEGRAPSPALAAVFSRFRDWLLAIYDKVKAQQLPVIDSVRGVFARLVGAPDQVVIAPDRELPLTAEAAQAARADALGIAPTNETADAALAAAARAEAAAPEPPATPPTPPTRTRNP